MGKEETKLSIKLSWKSLERKKKISDPKIGRLLHAPPNKHY